nr:MAG TPA: hypothetical protein [Caudoviricetes sp.]
MSGARNADISANIASMSGRFGCFSANDLYSSLFRSFLSFFTFLIPLSNIFYKCTVYLRHSHLKGVDFMRRCKIVIALVLAACIGITVAYIASMASLLPGVEFRYVTNGRTGEPVSLLGSLIAYGFIWLIFNGLISTYFCIAISIAGTILKRCGYKQEIDKLLNDGLFLNRLGISAIASTVVTGFFLLLYMFNIISLV